MIKTINVTQRDIDRGKILDCRNCPIAKAMKRVIKQPIIVGDLSYRINNSTPIYFNNPGVTLFVRMFDMRREVKPFKFKLDIVL